MVMDACGDKRWGNAETCVSRVAPCVRRAQQLVRLMRAARVIRTENIT
jgi:hypothetical protein